MPRLPLPGVREAVKTSLLACLRAAFSVCLQASTLNTFGAGGGSQFGSASSVGGQRSDSIILIRVVPKTRSLALLSIPRDTLVPVPGYGTTRINTAFTLGGASLAVRTIENFTGLRINHVMIVDFRSFTNLIDNIGGIDINVPEPILSNKFDCPYKAARCARWQGYRFRTGMQHMSGHRGGGS